MQEYICLSIDLNLFFLRIMKEHSFFLEASLPPKNKNFIDEAERFKNEFERLLLETIKISNNFISPQVLRSGEIVTEYTLTAERQTENLSGIALNKNLTMMEQQLPIASNYNDMNMAQQAVKQLNNQAIGLVDELINFKTTILNQVLSCNMFTTNYPLLIDHILREARLYRSYLARLEAGQNIKLDDIKQEELFWNQIMMEHALFIRGLLDPTENELIATADNFANEYKLLLEETNRATAQTMPNVTNKAIQETQKYKQFKTAGAKGLTECEIKSIIIPLLADHVLREANHYLRILKG